MNPDQAIALARAMQTGDDVLGDGIKLLMWENPRKPWPQYLGADSAFTPDGKLKPAKERES